MLTQSGTPCLPNQELRTYRIRDSVLTRTGTPCSPRSTVPIIHPPNRYSVLIESGIPCPTYQVLRAYPIRSHPSGTPCSPKQVLVASPNLVLRAQPTGTPFSPIRYSVFTHNQDPVTTSARLMYTACTDASVVDKCVDTVMTYLRNLAQVRR